MNLNSQKKNGKKFIKEHERDFLETKKNKIKRKKKRISLTFNHTFKLNKNSIDF